MKSGSNFWTFKVVALDRETAAVAFDIDPDMNFIMVAYKNG
jgi:hypothetical protein